MNVTERQASVDRAASLLRALSNDRRLMILCQLVEGEKSVGQLVENLEVAQATISQQLAVLKREGLVSARREGKNIYYALDNPVVESIINILHQAYGSVK